MTNSKFKGALLTTTVIAGVVFSSPAFAQQVPPATTSPSNTTSETPTAPEEQVPAPGKGSNGAQTTTDQKGEQAIVVTGTVSKQTQTASPVTVVTASNLQDRGVTTVADAVQQLAANNAGADPASWSAFGFATGASAPSLRGFNDAYTVTLFDGLRTAYYPLADDGFRNFVDINTIPESIVDRIEVLQDGASANYGADAIAGVVNVIVKREIQGVHVNGSAGISQRGDAGERRLDATVGYGSLANQGFNIYLNGEYQKNDPLWMRDRGYPFNTADQSRICANSMFDGQRTCAFNGVINGVQYNGDYLGFGTTTVGYAIPYSAPGVPDGPAHFQLLDPARGCQGLTAIQLTPGQISGTTPSNGVVCQQDFAAQYRNYQSKTERRGLNAHGTVNITPDIQAYAMANFYQTKTASSGTPESFTGQTTPSGGSPRVVLSRIYLPVYVCPTAVTTVAPAGGALPVGTVTSTGCTAANGTLNPNNPFAAQGDIARLSERYDRPTATTTNSKTYRLSGGISGSLSGFNFNVEATTSKINLDIAQSNYINLKNLLTVIGNGGYNFVDQTQNTQAQRDFLSPTVNTRSTSKLTEIQATVGRDLVALPGGDLNVAVGASYRKESINNPSSNGPNLADPTDRYFGINAVAASGSRNVKSLYYSVDVPAFTGFDFKAEGRYDKYSTGQHAFSPKFEAQFRPIQELKIRGTYSKGFRIPSFNESSDNGVPTTGYVTAHIDCGRYVDFCAQHPVTSYYQPSYSYGLSSVGNPNLKPEKSTSITAGLVFDPTRQLTMTVDYWHTKIKDIIIPATASQAIFDQYYLNNGNVNLPNITVLPGIPDPNNPTGLPVLGFIQSPYLNADEETGEGVDLSATVRLPLNHSGLRLISTVTASYLSKLELTDPANGTQIYAGTLSPCAITSCSGAPKWRGQWQNTLDFGGNASITATTYYTSGYSQVSTDSGGVYGDCLASTAGMSALYYDNSPITCNTKATWDVDLTGQIKVAQRLTLYANVLNVLDTKPPYDPNAGYGLYQFNPAWADRNFVGRYFRIGARVDW